MSMASNQESGLEIDWIRPKSGDVDILPMRIPYHKASVRRFSAKVIKESFQYIEVDRNTWIRADNA